MLASTHPLGLSAAGDVEPLREAQVPVEFPRNLGVLRLRGTRENAWKGKQNTHTEYRVS